MKTYLVQFLVALFTSLTVTPVLRRVCERLGWLDASQDFRRMHRKPICRLGGVAIFIAVAASLASLLFMDTQTAQAVRAHSSALLMVFAPATLVLLFGIYDDLRGSSAAQKLIALFVAAVLFYALGGRIVALSIPFWGTVNLPWILSFILTLIWIIGIANAFNLIDGIDGLASGAALFASLVLLFVAFHSTIPFIIIVMLGMAGALIGFLRYNFNPASIFLATRARFLWALRWRRSPCRARRKPQRQLQWRFRLWPSGCRLLTPVLQWRAALSAGVRFSRETASIFITC